MTGKTNTVLHIHKYPVLRPIGLTYSRYMSTNTPEYKVNKILSHFAMHFSSLFSSIGYLEMTGLVTAKLREEWELSNTGPHDGR